MENRRTLRNQVVCGARGQGLDGQPRVRGPFRGQDASVADEEIGNIVRAPERVQHVRRAVSVHARSSYQMRVARLLHHLDRSRRVHHVHRHALAVLDELFVVVVQIEIDVGHG